MNAIELSSFLLDGRQICSNMRKDIAAELRRLHAENESLRKDAGRYRFLVGYLYTRNFYYGEASISLSVAGACPSMKELDQAIDAAMGEGKDSLVQRPEGE